MIRRERGTTTVEFAIVGAAAMLVLFGVLEVARALFVWNTLAEATRRGARVAAVCPIGSPTVPRVAIFGNPGADDTSPVLPNLTTANVQVEYLDETDAATTEYDVVKTVRVSIVDYEHTFLIPFIGQTVTVPGFSTTLPVESLGYIPDTGLRQCFGI